MIAKGNHLDTPTSLGAPGNPELSLSSRLWIWSFPLAFIVHDAEEVMATVQAGELKSVGTPLSVSQGISAIFFELALFWLISVLAVWGGRGSFQLRAFAAVLAGYTLHGLVHLGAALVGSGYVFGAITALAAVIVYGGLALFRLHRYERRSSAPRLTACT